MFTFDTPQHLMASLGEYANDGELEMFSYEVLHEACNHRFKILVEFGWVPHLLRWSVRDLLGIADVKDALNTLAQVVTAESLAQVPERILLESLPVLFDYVGREDVDEGRLATQMCKALNVPRSGSLACDRFAELHRSRRLKMTRPG